MGIFVRVKPGVLGAFYVLIAKEKLGGLLSGCLGVLCLVWVCFFVFVMFIL